RDAPPANCSPPTSGAYANDPRLGLQPVRLAAHGPAPPAHDPGRGRAGVSRGVSDLLLGPQHAALAPHLAPGAGSRLAGARCHDAAATLLLLQLPRRPPPDAGRPV